ncbi:ABC transporter ATP-binding protein [Victivallaceae bacterium BBE-744-WT-12]|uniref:ABC transporter ATP-binding protein n=1 Tax=Victivallis lenta TaxID=2606640 RepID=A0A844G2B7_9BACT|nr:ABC transporter ATP-binding protein [Victivallis lenta]MST97094.1 ABC transporter ATP-binding protein [Victivallis lenta]
MSEQENIIELRGVTRTYKLGREKLPVLRGVDWEIRRGEWACLLGASGSGKTTLLNLIGTLEQPDSGTIRIAGVDVSKLGRGEAARFRNRKIGFVFQAYHLLPELTVLENVMLPGNLAGLSRGEAKKRAVPLLETVGLSGRMRHRPSELSGGEQQRAAIARALLNEPELLLADEPTGNLDTHTGEAILELFTELRKLHPGRSIMMITHNWEIAKLADRTEELVDGRLTNQ